MVRTALHFFRDEFIRETDPIFKRILNWVRERTMNDFSVYLLLKQYLERLDTE